ncbi:uL30 family ribosomal protein [Candidatus Woesearchaeota archaeon]|nr:uL30 family ribosomal protein [Candidatus Woesearchaeota archaeon]
MNEKEEKEIAIKIVKKPSAKTATKVDKTDKPQKTAAVKKQALKKETSDNIAVVLVRGLVNLTEDKKSTLRMLNLHKKNNCVVVKNNPVNKGMIFKVKDYVAYGEIDDETYALLVKMRKDAKDNKKTFRLSPPKGGFRKKGIKKPFGRGGALGYRGRDINNLLKRML